MHGRVFGYVPTIYQGFIKNSKSEFSTMDSSLVSAIFLSVRTNSVLPLSREVLIFVLTLEGITSNIRRTIFVGG